MRKLTKTIKRRRKLNKPTIGLVTESGRRISFNAEVYYIEKAKEAKLEAERYAKQFMHKFLKEKCPEMMKRIETLQSILGGLGSFMYY
jgi:hypothetical protein